VKLDVSALESMELLVWNETDFASCLEVLPEVEEYGVSYRYQVEKHGMRLELTVFPYARDVYITLHCNGVDRPVIDFRMIDCSGTRYVNDTRGEYLEFAPAQVWPDRFCSDFVIPMGVRLSVKPSISLELFTHSA
jgi:hypothetical protein